VERFHVHGAFSRYRRHDFSALRSRIGIAIPIHTEVPPIGFDRPTQRFADDAAVDAVPCEASAM
jgi:hypothetical protein